VVVIDCGAPLFMGYCLLPIGSWLLLTGEINIGCWAGLSGWDVRWHWGYSGTMADTALPTIHRSSDARPFTWGEAMRAWTPYAVQTLRATAAQDRPKITYQDLAEAVQRESGVVTSEAAESWVERLLAHVAKSVEASEAAGLVACCVADLGTGAKAGGRAKAGRTARATKPGSRATAPAARASAATALGGRSAATRAAVAPKRRKAEEEPVVVCESCFMQLPANGVCDNCG